jgi:hypothetical protein
MVSSLDKTEALIRTLLRSIDKRVEYSVAVAENDTSRFNVSVSLQKQKASVSLRAEDLAAAEQDLMRRNQVRTVLKRAIDSMMFRPASIASTAMLRPDSQAEGFFRAPSYGKKRR